jgi:hypothetical protein
MSKWADNCCLLLTNHKLPRMDCTARCETQCLEGVYKLIPSLRSKRQRLIHRQIRMRLAVGGAPAAVKRRSRELVKQTKILPVSTSLYSITVYKIVAFIVYINYRWLKQHNYDATKQIHYRHKPFANIQLQLMTDVCARFRCRNIKPYPSGSGTQMLFCARH